MKVCLPLEFSETSGGYPADTLHETIRGFHDTHARLEVFRRAVEKDVCGRADSVQKEIEFVLAREDVANVFGKLRKMEKCPCG